MKRLIVCAILLALASTPSLPAELPPGLTPELAAEGWIALFDGESTFGWHATGTVAVTDGTLVVGDKAKVGKLRTSTRFPQAFDLVFDTAPSPGGDGVLYIWYGGSGKAEGEAYDLPAGQTVTLRHRGHELTIVKSASKKGEAKPIPTIDVPGPVAIGLEGAGMRVRSIKLRPLGGEPLFNGKDLTGWTVFKDEPAKAKAEFTVTPAGELHVFGGPGDIRTEKKFADFVLQTQIKTAGPTVNSGIFFRSVPDQYQNGYECQIQNAFKENDRTKPFDFGTGAIYRRIPARKVVPNDKEWFTLTLVANGPHLATWVNGYQVVDWTDDRPKDENPRKGLRTDAGHISIQGHNPPMSADLLFRDMRIVEMKNN